MSTEHETERTLKTVLLFGSSQIAAFDAKGQVPELQEPLILEWAKRAEQLGYNVDGLIVETQFAGKLRLRRNDEGGWNFEVLQ